MSFTKLGYVVLAVILSTSLGGFALGQLKLRPGAEKSAAPGAVAGATVDTPALPKAEAPKPAKPDDARPATGRRREAVIKVPVGTFVKDMDAGTYGSGRLTWTFEEEKVHGIIEANVMGVEVELRTEAEFSLSSNGTIYGIVTGVELTHLKVGAGGALGGIGEYIKFVKLAEPLINEMLTDLPFSYQFRISGDKLTILNFRALLAGPNPLGKIGGLVGGDNSLAVLSYFQALGAAVEGTYTAGEAEHRDKPKVKPIVRKPMEKK
jgi:hypothetical protein